MLRQLTAMALLAASVACGSTPTSPEPSGAPSAASNPLTETGTWRGFLRIDTCVDARGSCSAYASGLLVPFALRVAPSGQRLSALFTNEMFSRSILLSGVLGADGAAEFSGELSNGETGNDLWRIKFTTFRIAPDANAGLTGSIAFTLRSGSETMTVAGTVASASMQRFVAATSRPFEGTWDGYLKATRCRGNCLLFNGGNRISAVIPLVQTGTAVRGEILGLRVEGTVSGNKLTLAGEARAVIPPHEEGAALRRIEAFSATVDDLGRLVGSFRYVQEGMTFNRFELVPFAGTADIELETVIRRY